MQGVVAHRVYSPEEPLEVEGCAYTYVMAGNGLFVACSSPHLRGCAQVAEGEVRGLPALRPFVHLTQGPIPSRFLWTALEMMTLQAPDELAVAIALDDNDAYVLRVPEQRAGRAHVEYDRVPRAVLEIHSHPGMMARFSGVDDADEQRFGLFGVVGLRDSGVSIAFRLSIYGHFQPVAPRQVFGISEVASELLQASGPHEL